MLERRIVSVDESVGAADSVEDAPGFLESVDRSEAFPDPRKTLEGEGGLDVLARRQRELDLEGLTRMEASVDETVPAPDRALGAEEFVPVRTGFEVCRPAGSE